MSRFIRIRTYSIRRSLGVGVLAVATVATACQDDGPSPLAPAPHASASKGGNKPGTGESVLFAGNNGSTAEVSHIYVMNPDGSNVRQLTADSASDIFPDFAPDNRKFVFVRAMGTGKSELFTANADGTKQTQLTTIGTFVMHPRYSPDGTKIAFVAFSPDNGGDDIYTINADGTGLKRLTYERGVDQSPAWSPDGQQIAFDSDRTNPGVPFIYLMNADGLNVRLLEGNNIGAISQPAWSPDGTRIAVAGPGGAMFVISLVTKTSSPVGPLFTDGESGRPTWSEDSQLVLFTSSRGIERTYEIYSSPPGTTDPTKVRRLTVFSPGAAVHPSYSH